MMDRDAIRARVEAEGLVPVIRVPTAALAARAAEALLAGGVSVFEITLTVPGALEAIAELVRRHGDRAVIGAGTVLTAEQANACLDAGATFVVSPGLDPPTIEAARARGAAVLPGALTPTEILTAWNAGADLVKVFPCSALGGASYIKALRGPLPHVKLLPTGGVTLATVRAFITAGAAALGIGTELVDVAALEAGRDGEITERARALLAAVRDARAAQARHA